MPEPHSADADTFAPRMPDVDVRPDIGKIFDQARKAAGESGSDGKSSRQVVLVTPGRMLMLQPCPPPGTMPAAVVTQVERFISPKTKRTIAVIAYTELKALTTSLAKAIPFFGMLSAMTYIGHSVWIFEGHPSALAAGCKGADILMVDGAMLPHLAADWQLTASSDAPRIQMYVHDRATHGVSKIN